MADRSAEALRGEPKTDAAIDKVALSLDRFGWRQPIVVDEASVVIAGHTRLLAAHRLGYADVPVHVAAGLTAKQVRAYRLMDDRCGEEAVWDDDLLAAELAALGDLPDFDLGLTGFSDDEIGRLMASLGDGGGEGSGDDGGGQDTGGGSPGDPGEDRYQEQYGVIVVCADEKEQGRVYNRLAEQGLECRVVCT